MWREKVASKYGMDRYLRVQNMLSVSWWLSGKHGQHGHGQRRHGHVKNTIKSNQSGK